MKAILEMTGATLTAWIHLVTFPLHCWKGEKETRKEYCLLTCCRALSGHLSFIIICQGYKICRGCFRRPPNRKANHFPLWAGRERLRNARKWKTLGKSVQTLFFMLKCAYLRRFFFLSCRCLHGYHRLPKFWYIQYLPLLRSILTGSNSFYLAIDFSQFVGTDELTRKV